MTNSNETKAVVSTPKSNKKTELEILLGGGSSLEEFLGNYEYLTFVIDGSGSMGETLAGGTMTKWELQRRVIRKTAETKLRGKIADMKVAIITFANRAKTELQGSSDFNQVSKVVDAMYLNGGGTSIKSGLESALSNLQKRGGDLVPRVILTSDGQDFDAMGSMAQAQMAVSKGVVIDTIYIGNGSEYEAQYADQLRRISELTGGVHEEITNEGEFEQKFLKVALRGLIGSGSV